MAVGELKLRPRDIYFTSDPLLTQEDAARAVDHALVYQVSTAVSILSRVGGMHGKHSAV